MRDDEEHGGAAGAVAARSAWKLIAWIGGGTFCIAPSFLDSQES